MDYGNLTYSEYCERHEAEAEYEYQVFWNGLDDETYETEEEAQEHIDYLCYWECRDPKEYEIIKTIK